MTQTFCVCSPLEDVAAHFLGGTFRSAQCRSLLILWLCQPPLMHMPIRGGSPRCITDSGLDLAHVMTLLQSYLYSLHVCLTFSAFKSSGKL